MKNGRAYRVRHVVDSKEEPEYLKVNSPEEGVRMIKVLINRDSEDETISKNIFGVEVYGEDGWEEWFNGSGSDATSIIEHDSENEENE